MAVVVIGAGGHARVLLELMDRAGIAPIAGLVDDDPGLLHTKVGGMDVLGSLDRLPAIIKAHRVHSAVIAFDNNDLRRQMGQHVRSLGLRLTTLIHPTAIVAPTAQVGDGTVIMAGAIINMHAQLGELCLVDLGVIVDHDVMIGDEVHIGPGVTLTADVTVGNGVTIGAGATVIPGICIGDEAVIGAGATVVRDVPSMATVVGCPAKPIVHHAHA